MEEGLIRFRNVDQVDLKILSILRRNSRETLTNISRETGIPVSSVFDRLKRLESSGVINRHTCLLDMEKIGIHDRVIILAKVKKEMEKDVESWLMGNQRINNLLKVNGGWNFMAEALFHNIPTLEYFMQDLTERFQGIEISVQYVLKDLKREGFSPDLCGGVREDINK